MTDHHLYQRADARRNRALLLTAARKACQQGWETVQLRDVATAAGLGVGTVYRHFPTREDLLETLAREHVTQIQLIAEGAASVDDPFEALAVLLRLMLDKQFDQPGLSAVLTAAADVQHETTKAKASLDAAIATLLARAQRTGRVRDDVTAADLRQLVGGIALARNSGDSRGFHRAYLHLTILITGLQPNRQNSPPTT